MGDMKYGSRDWMESQYASSKDDPWGLDWRPSQQYRYARMLDALTAALASDSSPSVIVDVGCATGMFTAMLKRLCPKGGQGMLVGVDIAESAVARATARFPDIRFERMALDASAREFDGTADVVTCMEVLYYLADEQRAEAVRQLKAMLKPGGTMLVSSMVAPAPYFSMGALNALVSSELRIVDTGALYLKPLALFEKLLMKLRGPAARNGMHVEYATVERLNRTAKRFLAHHAQSHAYVVARND